MSTIAYEIFISYSKNDEAFAELLEKQLESYIPPKSIPGLEKIRVFRYADDMTGIDYEEAILKYLKGSRTLVVICSPSSRKSKYVNGEIELFSKENQEHKIIPLLLAGIPNNEAKNESEKAFPENLYLKYKMPLAINFKNFKIGNDKISKGFYSASWYALLSEIYDISRELIEEREKKRIKRQRLKLLLTVSMIFLVIVSFAVVALLQRNRALKNEKIARSNFFASEAIRVSIDDPRKSANYAIESFALDNNYLSQKAIGTAFYNQPFYQTISNLSFEGSNMLYRNSMWIYLRFDEINNELLSINSDNCIRIFSTQSGEKKDSILIGDEPECIIPFYDQNYLIGFYNGNIGIYDRRQRKQKIFEKIEGKVSHLELNSTKNLLAIAAENKVFLKIPSKDKLVSYDSITTKSSITKISFQDNLLLVVSYNNEVALYDPKKKILIFRKYIPDLIDASIKSNFLYYITSKTFNLDSIHSYNLTSGQENSIRIEGVRSVMMTGLVLTNPLVFITGYNDKGIQIWDSLGNRVAFSGGSKFGETVFAVDKVGKVLYTGDVHGVLKKWIVYPLADDITGKHSFSSKWRTEKKTQIDNVVNNLKSKKEKSFIKDRISHCSDLYDLDHSNSYSILNEEKYVTFFQSENKCIYTYRYNKEHQKVDFIDSLKLNYYDRLGCIGINSKTFLAFSGADLIIWDLVNKRIISDINIGDNKVYSTDVSYEGKFIAVTFYDHISIYDNSGKLFYNIPIPFASENRVDEIVFSANCKKLITGTADRKILEWEIDPRAMDSIIRQRIKSQNTDF